MAANQLHCIVAEQLSRVALFLDELVVSVPIRFPVRRMSKIVDLPEYWSVLIVEPALPRPVPAISVSQVPLADDGGLGSQLPSTPEAVTIRQSIIHICSPTESPLSADRNERDSARSSVRRVKGYTSAERRTVRAARLPARACPDLFVAPPQSPKQAGKDLHRVSDFRVL